MATKNGASTLAGSMASTGAATGLVKATVELDGSMSSTGAATGLVAASLEMDGAMTSTGAATGLVQATVETDGGMTGTAAATGNLAQATVEFDGGLTSTGAASAHTAHATVEFDGGLTSTGAAYVTVPGAAVIGGNNTLTLTGEIDVPNVATLNNAGSLTPKGYDRIGGKATLNGSSSWAISSKVPGAAVLSGFTSDYFTPHISLAAPPATVLGRSTFVAPPIGKTATSVYGLAFAYATIGGVQVQIEAGTLSIKGVLQQRTTAQFTITDTRAAYNFIQGMYVVIRDAYNNRLFSGFVTTSQITKPTSGGTTIQHAIQASDVRYLTDKRIAATSYLNQTAGYIITDLVNNVLAGEGLFVCTGKNLFTDALSTSLAAAIPSGMGTVSASVTRADPLSSWNGQDVWQWTPNGATTYEELLALMPDATFTNATTYCLSFYARCLYGTPTIRYEGYESNPSTGFNPQTATLGSTWTRYAVSFTTPGPITNRGSNSFGLRIDTGAATYSVPIQIAGLQLEAGSSATAWEFGGAVTVQAGPTIVAMTINYKYVATMIDQLTQTAGFSWYCDQWNRLFFQTPGTTPAPFSLLSHTHMLKDSVTVTNTSPLYRNRQYITGINAVTSAQTETRQGDGKTRAFTFSFPLNGLPSAHTLNGATVTMGVKGVATGKDFYYAKGDPVIAQDPTGTLLTSADTLSMTYIGQYPSVVQSDDPAAQTLRASIEGFTTGIVEEVQTISSISSTAEGFQVAAGFLARYVPQGQQIVFDTYYAGLVPGMQATVSIPEMNIVNQSMLIEQVDIADGDPAVIYTVTAIIGPFDTNWVAFFKKMANPPNYIDAIGGGLGGTLALAQTLTATYPTYTATITATVTTVLYPSGTLYPSSTIYPT